MRRSTGEAKLDVQMKQGHPPFGVEMKITDDAGKPLPWDGKTFGRLKVRGPAVAKQLFQGRQRSCSTRTAGSTPATSPQSIAYGYMQITDRSKDVIKSGGEWISSIDLENLAVGHPKVAEAAVIGVRHPKWDERPLLVIVLKKGESASKDDILGFMQGKIAKWWMPDDVAFVDEIPHTATGKIQKIDAARALQGLPAAERAGRGVSAAFQTIRLERDGAVARLTLDRPQRLNAINKQMLGELQAALDQVESDDAVRALVVAGAGGNFSSGFDLKEQMEARPSGRAVWREILDRDFSAITRFWSLKKPTIAAVEGFCLAGGCELALCCDITIAAEDATFGEPELKFGAGIVVMMLPWLVGPKRAKEIILTGADRIPAREAHAIGLDQSPRRQRRNGGCGTGAGETHRGDRSRSRARNQARHQPHLRDHGADRGA